jgi:hypothetical protein
MMLAHRGLIGQEPWPAAENSANESPLDNEGALPVGDRSFPLLIFCADAVGQIHLSEPAVNLAIRVFWMVLPVQFQFAMSVRNRRRRRTYVHRILQLQCDFRSSQLQTDIRLQPRFDRS